MTLKKVKKPLPIVFFDGECNLCNGFVQFVLQHEKKPQFSFAPLQGTTARRMLRGKPDFSGKNSKTIYLIKEGKYYAKSAAFLRIVAGLEGVWKITAVLLIIPPFLRNIVYDLISANRKRIWGTTKSCWVMTPEVEQRFLK